MENFDHKNYRKNLAEKLKETPKEERAAILENAQNTEEYKIAKNLHQSPTKEEVAWTAEEYNKKNKLEKDGQITVLSNFTLSQIIDSNSTINKHFLPDKIIEFLLERGYLKPESYLNETWELAENHEVRSGHLGADDKASINALYKKAIITAKFIDQKGGVIPDEILQKIIKKGGRHIDGRGVNWDTSFSDIGVSIAKQNPNFAHELQQIYINNGSSLDGAKLSIALGEIEKARELLQKFSNGTGGYTSYDGQHGWYSTNDKQLSEFIKTASDSGLSDILKDDVLKLLALAESRKDGYPWFGIAGVELASLIEHDISFVEDILSKALTEDTKKYIEGFFGNDILTKIYERDKDYILNNKEGIIKILNSSNRIFSKISFALLIDDKDLFKESILELEPSRIQRVMGNTPIQSQEYMDLFLGIDKVKESLDITKDQVNIYLKEKKIIEAIKTAKDLIYQDPDYVTSFYKKILRKEIPIDSYQLATLIIEIEQVPILKKALEKDIDFDMIRESIPSLIKQHADLIIDLLKESTQNKQEISKEEKENLISKAILVNDESFLTFFSQTLSTEERKTLMDNRGGKTLFFSKIGSLMNHTHISRKNLIETGLNYPFILDALESNKRYGDKLLSWFSQFDSLSKENIQLLFESKKEIILKDMDVDQNSLEFRQHVQEKLKTYKNNPEILKVLNEKGIKIENWLNYDKQEFFDLGKEEKTKFSDVIKTPINRIKETVDKYSDVVKENINDFRKELSENFVLVEDIEEIKQKIDQMKVELEKAKTENNEQKAKGIEKGMNALEQKIQNPKKVPLWLKLNGDLSSTHQIKDKVFNMQEDILKTEEEVVLLGNMDLPQKEKRNIASKLKEKISKLQNEFKKELDTLENRLEKFQQNLPNFLQSALGNERTESILQALTQETTEQFDHYRSDYSTLRKLFSEQENEGGNLEGRPMRIQVWSRNPDTDLYLGNYTNCCIRIDSTHMGSECTIADYMTDLGMQVVEIIDEKTNEPISALWLFIAEDEKGNPALVIDNIEANTDYSNKFKHQLEKKLRQYMIEYMKDIGLKKLVQGELNNDLIVEPKIPSDYMKLGGYNRSDGYFLEAEPD